MRFAECQFYSMDAVSQMKSSRGHWCLRKPSSYEWNIKIRIENINGCYIRDRIITSMK